MKLWIAIAAMLTSFAALTASQGSPGASEGQVTLIIRFDASENGVAELTEILDGVPEAMSAEAGFVSAEIYHDIEDPQVFILTEIRESKALHQEHFERINQSGDWAYINSLLSSEPQAGYFRAS